MAVITSTTLSNQVPPTTITETAMTSSDTLTFTAGTNQRVKFRNPSASALTINLIGSAPVNVIVPNTGSVFTTTSGKTVTVAVGGLVSLDLDKISAYLVGSGTVTITGGTGGFAHLTT